MLVFQRSLWLLVLAIAIVCFALPISTSNRITTLSIYEPPSTRNTLPLSPSHNNQTPMIPKIKTEDFPPLLQVLNRTLCATLDYDSPDFQSDLATASPELGQQIIRCYAADHDPSRFILNNTLCATLPYECDIHFTTESQELRAQIIQCHVERVYVEMLLEKEQDKFYNFTRPEGGWEFEGNDYSHNMKQFAPSGAVGTRAGSPISCHDVHATYDTWLRAMCEVSERNCEIANECILRRSSEFPCPRG